MAEPKKEGGGAPGKAKAEMKATYSIYDCWWENAVDEDGDGYTRQRTLWFDADTSASSASVYALIGYRLVGASSWSLDYQTPVFTISGNSSSDAVGILIGTVPAYPHGTYQFRIELYTSDGTIVAARDYSVDTDMQSQKFETAAEDTLSSVITVSATDASAGEPSNSGTFTFTRTGSTASSLTVYFSVGGTATGGSDYTSLGSSATFSAGSPTATKTVSVIDDTLVEGNETVTVTLTSNSAYTIGSPSSATVTIADDDVAKPTVTVSATDASAGEPSNSGTFTFTRTGATASSLTVYFSVGGTATGGTDYTSLGSSATFSAGSSTATKTVSVINDTLVEGNETVTVTLTSNSAYTIGSPSSATVTIADDDSSGGTSTRRALLVGIDHYSPSYGAGDLPSCVNDAMGMRDTVLLADPDSRWPSSGVMLLADAQATKSAVRSALQNLAAVSQSGDIVLYFHSSHGGQTSGTSTFICTYNADFTDTELGTDLALFQTGTKVVVIVDTCHSGGLFKSAGWPFAERVMEAYQTEKAKRLAAAGEAVPKALGQNIAFMTACDYYQTSAAGNPYSLYAGYLIAGCSATSVDSNSDGVYQFYELHTYAATQASAANPGQTAQSYNPSLLQSLVARSRIAGGGSGGGPYISPIGYDDLLSTVGSYDAYIYAGDSFNSPEAPASLSGILSVKITKLTGALTAKAIFQSGTVSFTGKTWYDVDGDGHWAVLSARTGESLVLLICQNRLIGMISGGKAGEDDLLIDGARNRFANRNDYDAKVVLDAAKGYYTSAVWMDDEAAINGDLNTFPQGYGYLTLTVGNGGSAKLSGKLADGTSASMSSRLLWFEQDGKLCAPLFLPLYSKKGVISGLIWLDPATRQLDAEVAWLKPGVDFSRDGFYALGGLTGGWYNKKPAFYSGYTLDFLVHTWATPLWMNGVMADLMWGGDLEYAISASPVGKFSLPKGKAPIKYIDPVRGIYWYNYEEFPNTTMTTLSFSAATGIFRGTSKAYYDHWDYAGKLTHKAVSVPYVGVMVQDGDGVVSWGAGANLVSETYPDWKRFKIKWSGPVLIH